MEITIIHNPDDVMRFCDDIVALASARPKEFGFPPKQAYEGEILRNLVHVALLQEQEREVFAGHIWLGGRWPAKRIVQVAVCDKYQRKGIAGKLLQDAIHRAQNSGFLTISAKVGKSLPANSFWKKQGFIMVETVEGKSTHPYCNIWEKALVPNTLLSSVNSSRTNGSVLKRIIDNVKTEFSIMPDTNVFINANNGAKEVCSIFRRALCGQIKIIRSSVTTKELSKHQGDGEALKLALQISESTASGDSTVIEELRKIIFPEKYSMTDQDKLDLESIAIAIAADVSMFVTEDKAILRRAPEIHKRFSLDISHPVALWNEMLFDGEAGKSPAAATLEDGFYFVINPQKAALKKANFAGADKESSLCVALQNGENILGVISFSHQTELHTQKVSLYVKPGDNDKYVADLLLGWIRKGIIGISKNPSSTPLKVELTPYKGINAAQIALSSHGYTSAPPEKIYWKMHANQIIIRRNWKKFHSDLSRSCGIQMPDNIPDFCRYDQPMQIAPDATVQLNKLEDYLSSVFILPGRGGVVMPIKKWFAESFFNHSQQGILFPVPAELLGHKSYLGTTRAKLCLQVGTPLLFYQSENKPTPGQIVAVARVVRTQVIDTSKLSDAQKRHLVLTSGDIRTLKNPTLETVFDNCVILPKPVTLEELKQMKCNDPTGFVTATSIEYKKLHKILKKGLSA